MMPDLNVDSIVFAEGDEWKTKRKFLASVLHYEFLKSNVPAIVQTAKDIIAELEKSNKVQNVDMLLQGNKYAGEIIGRLFFGENLNKYEFEGKNLVLASAELIREMNLVGTSPLNFFCEWLVKLRILPSHRRLLNKINRFREACKKIMVERKNKWTSKSLEGKNKTLLDSCLLLNEESGEDIITPSRLTDMFVGFITGGKDTTAHFMSMAFYYLAMYPEMRQQIEVEIEKHYNKEGGVTLENLAKMEYLEAFLKEVLRVASPFQGVMLREAVQDHNIMDIKVKKGTIVTISGTMNHFNPNNFENPDKFNPERWLEKGKQVDPFAYLPFSAGQRNCIGQHLAMTETKVFISEFLRKFEFKLIEGYKLNMMMRSFYAPEVPITMDLKKK